MSNILLAFLLVVSFCDFQLSLFPQLDQPQSIKIYSDGELAREFNESTFSNGLTCSAGNLYILERKQESNQALAQLYSNILFSRGDISFSCSPNLSPCPSLLDISTSAITITLGCPLEPSDGDYYNKVDMSLGGKWKCSFMLDCDQGDRHKKFEIGYFMIAALNLVLMVGVALHSRLASYKWRNAEVGIKATWKAVLVIVVVLVGVVVLLVKLEKLTQAAKVIGCIIGPIFLMMCLNEGFFLIEPLRKPIVSPIRYCDVLSFLSAALILTLSLLYQDFISNAILASGIIIASIKLFKFTSLKQAAICCGILMSVETVAAVVYHYASPDQSYNDVFGRDIVSPILMQFPSLTESLYKKCSWVPVTEIIFPGITISYLRRFEFAREGRRPYLWVSNLAFFVSTVIWLFCEAVYAHTFPFALVTYPVTFLSVIVLAHFCMNQLKVIWSGKWEDPQWEDNEQYQKGLLKPQEKQEGLSDELFEGMKASDRFPSDLSLKSQKQKQESGQKQPLKQLDPPA